MPPAISVQPTGYPPANTSGTALWASCRQGIIDTRPFAAVQAQADVSRILEYGGGVVCFCSTKLDSGLVLANTLGGGVSVERELHLSTYDLVAGLSEFDISGQHGEEIQPLSANTVFAALTPHLQSARYACTIAPPERLSQSWFPLARNKFGADVAGAFQVGKGAVVLLPQVADIGATVQALLDDILPEVIPVVFPESEKFGWRERPPYELPEIRRLRSEIEQARAAAHAREQVLTEQIETVKDADGWLLDLLSGTGSQLAGAVERALRELGLPDGKKLDEDEEVAEEGRLREDIQVGGSPALLVEVKGLQGLPKEEDALAVLKYRAPRMEQWQRTDIRGLAVINHQRSLPPLQRDNEHTFQDDVIKNMNHQSSTVITGFDLYRLVLNKRLLGWPETEVCPLFYENGRVSVVPKHYELVGVIERFFDKAQVVGIRVVG